MSALLQGHNYFRRNKSQFPANNRLTIRNFLLLPPLPVEELNVSKRKFRRRCDQQLICSLSDWPNKTAVVSIHLSTPTPDGSAGYFFPPSALTDYPISLVWLGETAKNTPHKYVLTDWTFFLLSSRCHFFCCRPHHPAGSVGNFKEFRTLWSHCSSIDPALWWPNLPHSPGQGCAGQGTFRSK